MRIAECKYDGVRPVFEPLIFWLDLVATWYSYWFALYDGSTVSIKATNLTDFALVDA